MEIINCDCKSMLNYLLAQVNNIRNESEDREWGKNNTYARTQLCRDCLNELNNVRWNMRRSGYDLEKRYYCLLTVNPRSDVGLEDIFTMWNKIKKKKWIKKTYSCVEWRGENEGMHLHMEIEYKWRNKKEDKIKPVCEIITECTNTCKKYIGNDRHCNFKFNINRGFGRYIDGYRKGAEKKSYDITKRMRETNGLNDILEL